MSSGRTNRELSVLIKQKSASLGFDLTGIARARALPEYESYLKNWVAAGMHDKMNYLSRDTEKRADPSALFPGVRSMIVTGFNYYTEIKQKHQGVPKISRYAYGRTYQAVIEEKLDLLQKYVLTLEPSVVGNIYVDSFPVLEKPWAVEAGLGWQGRHSIVINRNIGSFFFIGILALNIELDYDEPYIENHCGSCRLCIDQCPTRAVNCDGTIDARKCISNLTIENRAPLKDEIIPFLGGRVYACDKCQEVCPWNKNAKPHNHAELNIRSEVAEMSAEDWAGLTEDKFTELFSDTPIERVKFDRFRSNIDKIMSSPQ
jgi:epoxyqueuosine reductase